MGWGAKKAEKPQPDPDVAIAERRLAEIKEDPSLLISGEELEERLDAILPERAAEIEFMRLQANKGWTTERRYDVLRDFIRASGLYLKLNEFVRKMR